MPVVLDSNPLGVHVVVRRLAKEDLHGLAELLPAALGGDVDAWMGGEAWA